MQIGMQGSDVNKKRLVKRLIIIFIGVMVLLTFFSNTINNFTSPRVSCKRPESGQLVKEISGAGEIRAKKILEATIPLQMKVLSIDAKVGETVKKGQTIFTMDTSEIEDQIKAETEVYRLKELSVKKYNGELSEESLKEYDLTVDAALMKLESAKKKLENTRILFEAGAESAVNVKNAENELVDAGKEYEAAQIRRDKSVTGVRQELENAELELEIQGGKLLKLKEQLEFRKITAPSDGIIVELNFSEGAVADGSKPLFRLADSTEGFGFYASVDKEAAKSLAIGDMSEVEIDALGSGSFEASIMEINDDQEQRGVMKTIVMDVVSDGLMGGEKGSFELKKSVKDCPVLVPNSAVAQDANGYFVFVVNERGGPLGNEYYARKVRISTGGSDYMNTAVLSGISSYDEVISNSDKPLSDGMRVRVNQE